MNFRLALLVLLCVSWASADIPHVISYQGKVTDTGGNPVADNTYTMRFKIYDTALAGTLLWDSGDQSVAVAGGIFSVLLGESPQPALNLAFDEDYWLLVSFEGSIQIPRQRLASSGYAYMASGLVPGTLVSGAIAGNDVLEVENTGQNGTAIRATTSYTTPTQAGPAIVATTSGNGPAIEGYGGSNGGSTGVYGSGKAYGVRGVVEDFMGTSAGPDVGVDGEATYYNEYGSYGVRGQGQSHGGYFIGGPVGVYGRPSTTAVGTGVHGEATATTGTTNGVYGASASTAGRGVYGEATATTGATHGVYGSSASTAGNGVWGESTATTGTTAGVRGSTTSAQGYGVAGVAWATEGSAIGVYGTTASSLGKGVEAYATATTGPTFGIRGYSYSPDGTGVFARASATTGATYGMWGECFSSSGRGVLGRASASSGTTYGVSGLVDSPSGRAVFGEATATTGTAFGVYGLCNSTNGRAVYGHAIATSGECFGGRFESGSTGGRAVYAHAYSGSGVTYGVYGRSDSPSGKGVYYEGGLAGSGTKSCVVRTSQGPTLLYCQESPENWFEDFGEGQLVNGHCHIELDPLFLETVTIDAANAMHVFIQPYDQGAVGVVVHRHATGFEVVNLSDQAAGGAFSYRVVAKRRGFEEERLDVCEAALSDSHLYPELRDKEQREREAEEARMASEPLRIPETSERQSSMIP